MATKCDSGCEQCLNPNNPDRTLQRHICLKSEKRFLTSLLSKQDGQGLENLLGFDPTDLVDWFLYARRTYEAREGKTDFRAGLKLLDELAKLLFNAGQVTALADQGSSLLLVSKAEGPLAAAYIEGLETMSDEPASRFAKYRALATAAKNRLSEDLSSSTDSYVRDLEIRQGFVELWRPQTQEECDALSLTFPKRKLWILYWDEDDPEKWVISRRRLARAYLEGVGCFALGWRRDGTTGSELASGYWIDSQDSPALPSIAASGEMKAVPGAASRKTTSATQVYCGLPRPISPILQLACEVAASFLEEYLGSEQDDGSRDNLFDVLFMCKGPTGWYWAFSKDQLDVLLQVWSRSSESEGGASAFHRAIEEFRLGKAGFINLLERTENSVVELGNFRKEQFICTGVGYNLEAAKHLAKNFETIEAGIPHLQESSFCYFRITSHRAQSASPAATEEEEGLPEGALVAVARIPQNLSSVERVRWMGDMRAWLERWRAKDGALPRIRSVVQEIERPHQRRTARAAIMSRNLSHNIGSHSLANSRFYEAVGILHLQSERPGDNLKDEDALADPKTKRRPSRGEVWRARNRLSTLNGFLQGRMDFIARALGESPSHPEPMFFVNDLLRGFLSQTVLLNTLLSDNGFTAEKMRFQVFLPDQVEPVVFEKPPDVDGALRHAEFVPRPGSPVKDLLIGVPGGMVGRHAFYAFLENLLRNAAKYGERSRETAENPEGKFIVNFRLAERSRDQGVRRLGREDETTACYELTMTDSLSLDSRREAGPEEGAAPEPKGRGSERKVARRIRKHLDEDIIDPEGKAQTEGHGVQEMKVCAQFLAGGDQRALHYADDATCQDEALAVDTEYLHFLAEQRREVEATPEDKEATAKTQNKRKPRNSIRCFYLRCDNDGVPVAEGGERYLAYQLLLIRPTLLALASWPQREGNGRLVAPREATVAIHQSLEVLATEPAHIGVVVAGCEPDSELIARLSQLHTALPRRLMIAVPTKEARGRWAQALDGWQRERAAQWWRDGPAAAPETAFPLPPRRLGVICYPRLEELVRHPDEVEVDAWRQAVLEAYGHWLQVYKGEELEAAYAGTDDRRVWHLCVGFDRDEATVRSHWVTNEEEEPAFDSEHVRLHLRAWPRNDSSKTLSVDVLPALQHDESAFRAMLEGSDPRQAACLVLDNHGAVFRSPPRGVRVYHPVSGSEQVALFQVLEHPPADPLARAFLVYSMVEALLTRVIVVDERVGEAMIEKDAAGMDTVFGKKTMSLQRVGVFPLYTIHSEAPGPRRLSHQLSVAIESVLAGELDISGRSVAKEAGLVLTPRSYDPDSIDVRPVVIQSFDVKIASARECEPDCIVVHEGVVDQVHDREGWPLGAHRQLHSICPWVVRTSGRGSGARHLGRELPFLEFSELSDTVYRQMDKVSLGKALLSLRGGL